jgi:Zn-dependent protease with chaperone function
MRPQYTPSTVASVPQSPAQFGNSAVLAPMQNESLPRLEFPSNSVDPGQYLTSGAGFYAIIGWAIIGGGLLALALFTMGIGLLILVPGAIGAYFAAKRARAYIRGSSIQVSAEQMPEIHSIVQDFAQRLGLSETPELYIAEDSVANGFAVRLSKKNVIILTDDAVWGSLASPNQKALGFIIGHEMAHIALGHTGFIRSMMRNVVRPLARLDEMSADNVAKELIGDSKAAVQGLALLTVGPQLLRHLNLNALELQAREVASSKLSKKAERNLTHPLLLRRIDNMLRS